MKLQMDVGQVKGENVNSILKNIKKHMVNIFNDFALGFKELVNRMGEKFALENLPSKFYVFGTAPVCGNNFCDAVQAKKWPIALTKAGGTGASCVVGLKTVAIEPVADYQFEILEQLQDKCLHSQDLVTESWTNFWKTIEKGAEIVTFL